MSDQPKKQELPPLDERYVELTADLDGSEDIDADVRVRLALDCRERQLLAALSDNEAQEKAFQVVNNLVIAKCTRVKELYEEITALSAKLKSVEGITGCIGNWNALSLLARIREAIKGDK